MSKELAITGLGIISPIGTNIDEYWNNLIDKNNIVEPQKYPYDPLDLLNKTKYYANPELDESNLDRTRIEKWSIAGMEQALADSKMTIENREAMKVGIVLANNIGDTDILESALEGRNENAFLFNTTYRLLQNFGLDGPAITVSNACSSGLYALCIACDYVKSGLADAVIVGGVESIGIVNQACFVRLQATTNDYCRPFDKKRTGTITSDGCAFIVIESVESVKKRGKSDWHATIKGYSMNCDGYHVTSPDPSGEMAQAAILESIKDANISPADIQAIIPHGTGTKLNDFVESKIINNVFQNYKQPFVTGIKSRLGHSIAAAGAFSIITGCLMLKDKICPPTINVNELDKDNEINLCTEITKIGDLRNILINAYAFGGNNASVIIGR